MAISRRPRDISPKIHNSIEIYSFHLQVDERVLGYIDFISHGLKLKSYISVDILPAYEVRGGDSRNSH